MESIKISVMTLPYVYYFLDRNMRYSCWYYKLYGKHADNSFKLLASGIFKRLLN